MDAACLDQVQAIAGCTLLVNDISCAEAAWKQPVGHIAKLVGGKAGEEGDLPQMFLAEGASRLAEPFGQGSTQGLAQDRVSDDQVVEIVAIENPEIGVFGGADSGCPAVAGQQRCLTEEATLSQPCQHLATAADAANDLDPAGIDQVERIARAAFRIDDLASGDVLQHQALRHSLQRGVVHRAEDGQCPQPVDRQGLVFRAEAGAQTLAQPRQ